MTTKLLCFLFFLTLTMASIVSPAIMRPSKFERKKSIQIVFKDQEVPYFESYESQGKVAIRIVRKSLAKKSQKKNEKTQRE